MAKEGIGSFLLDCRLDDDLSELEAEYGLKGFAIIVRIWQKIHAEKGYYCEWKERSPFLFLSNWFGGNSGVDIGLINEVINKAIKIGIFNESLFDKYSILTSELIQERYLCAAKRWKKVELVKEYLLLNVGNFNGNVYIISKNVDINPIDVYKNLTKKGKEKKGKESNDIVSAFEEAATASIIFSEDSFEVRCVDMLITSCLEQLPNSKVPQTIEDKQKWASEIEKMRRLDKRTDEQIMQGLAFAIQDTFWSGNIRSTKKFREKFETLYLQSKAKNSTPVNKFQNFTGRNYNMNELEKNLVQR